MAVRRWRTSTCDSVVRVAPEDLSGRFADLFEWSDHPDPVAYPNVKVASCELTAGHLGRCEMFVDSLPAPDGRLTACWLTWQRSARSSALNTDYQWITAPAACETQSSNGYWCSRPTGHHGDHSFTVPGP